MAMHSFHVQSNSTVNASNLEFIPWEPPAAENSSKRKLRNAPSPSRPHSENPELERIDAAQNPDLLTWVPEPPSMPGMSSEGVMISAKALTADIPKFTSNMQHRQADCGWSELTAIVLSTPQVGVDVTKPHDDARYWQHRPRPSSPTNSLLQETARRSFDAFHDTDDGSSHVAAVAEAGDTAATPTDSVVNPRPLWVGTKDEDMRLYTDRIEADSTSTPTVPSSASIGQSHGLVSSPILSTTSIILDNGSSGSDDCEDDNQQPWRPSRASRMRKRKSMKMSSTSNSPAGCSSHAVQASDNSPASRRDVDTLETTTIYVDDCSVDDSWSGVVTASLEDKGEGDYCELHLASTCFSRISPSPKRTSSSPPSSSSSCSIAPTARRAMLTGDSKSGRPKFDRPQPYRRASMMSEPVKDVLTKRRRGRPRKTRPLDPPSTNLKRGRGRPRTMSSSASLTSVDKLLHLPHETGDTGCVQEDDEQPQFEIDRISDIQTIKGIPCVRVHWKPTWEPLVDVKRNAANAVAEYFHQRKAVQYCG